MAHNYETWQQKINQFQKTFGIEPVKQSTLDDLILMRAFASTQEEINELIEAVKNYGRLVNTKNVFNYGITETDIAAVREHVLKEGTDLMYVLADFLTRLDMDWELAFNRVHMNNMAKVWPDGKIHKNDNGKVVKPPGHAKPDLSDLV